MSSKTHIYFASDFHLGVPSHSESRKREDTIVRWLDHIKTNANEIYLVGDIFDFWFEYSSVIPKGFIRLQGKLAELSDAGILIHFFTGNHDMWMFDYFEKELGINIYREPITRTFNNKQFYIGHGDALGPGDYSYKFLKQFFASKLCQWLFARIHPNFSFWVANNWSRKSRISSNKKEEFLGNENEWLAIYAKEVLQKEHFDYFVFGHRHLPLDIQLSDKSRYINLGEWMNYRSYAVFDGEDLKICYFEG